MQDRCRLPVTPSPLPCSLLNLPTRSKEAQNWPTASSGLGNKRLMLELARWDNFYVIVGSAAGALIGLQFVVLTLIADRPPAGAEQAGAAFGSPTIVHFGTVLFLSALLHAPWQTIAIAAAIWG